MTPWALLGRCFPYLFTPKNLIVASKINAVVEIIPASAPATAFQRILDNYSSLLKIWDECLQEGKLQSDIRGRIIGCKSQMLDFDFYFGLHLGSSLFSHTDNLSKALQSKTMSTISARRNGEVTLKVLSNLRNEESFRLFYNKVVTLSKSYAFEKGPRLSRKRRVPPRFEIGSGENSYPETPEDHYRTIYYEGT